MKNIDRLIKRILFIRAGKNINLTSTCLLCGEEKDYCFRAICRDCAYSSNGNLLGNKLHEISRLEIIKLVDKNQKYLIREIKKQVLISKLKK